PPDSSPLSLHDALPIYRAGIARNLTYPATSLGRILDQTADRFGKAPALIYCDKQWTYRELLAQVNRMAGGLASLGIRRGDRVLRSEEHTSELQSRSDLV